MIRLLAISVSGNIDTANQAPTDDPKTKALWIVILLAIIIVSILAARLFPAVSQSLKSRKKNSAKSKAEKERDEELERLHRIKEKNKRK